MDNQHYQGYDHKTVSEKYHIRKSYVLRILLALLAPAVPAIIDHKLLEQTYFVAAMATLMACLLLIMLIMFAVPLVEVHALGVRFRQHLFGKKTDVTYEQIMGMSKVRFKQFGQKKQEVLRFLIRRADKVIETESLPFSMIDEPERLYTRLKRQVRELEGKHVASAARSLGGNPLPERIKYSSYTLDADGINWKNPVSRHITWKDITSITLFSTQSSLVFVLLVTYQHSSGKERTLRFGKSLLGGFQDMVRYLVLHATEAHIDPAVIPILTKPEKKVDGLIKAIVIPAITILFVSFFVMPFSIEAYRLLVGPGQLGLLFGVFALFSIAYALLLFISIYRRQSGLKGTSPTVLSVIYSVSIVLLVAGFYTLNSPLLPYTMIGDIYFDHNRFEKADSHYQKALVSSPENQALLTGLGELHNEMGEYEEAYGYLEKAYVIDPAYFTKWEAGLLLDSLTKQEKCQDIFTWCERISNDHRGDAAIRAVVQKHRLTAKGRCVETPQDNK